MHVAVLGTGMVGRAHAEKLASLGHRVTLGTRDRSVRDTAPADAGDDSLAAWRADHPKVDVQPFGLAVAQADLVIVALNGRVAVDVLTGIADELGDTVVIDLTNPLDFSSGQLELFVCNTDSLGEQIQRALPTARVVKTLCTVTAEIQVDPAGLADGAHDMFLAGNDAEAKASVAGLLRQYGWRSVLDLGDLTAARGMEMMLPTWLKIMQARGTARFNYRVVTDASTSPEE